MKKMLITEIWSIAQTNHGCVVFLQPGDTEIVVPVIIGPLELQSILIGREKILMPRPLTHDLLLNVLTGLDMNLKQIEIHSLVNDTFYARLILEGREFSDNKALDIDCRPSDAIALAVRKKCPIYLSADLIKKTGIPIDFFMEEMEKTDEPPGNTEKSAPQNQYQYLIRQLNMAIEKEEYERAAEIRDLLIQLEKTSRK